MDESFANDFDGPNRIYTLNFAASSVGQTLTVKFIVLRSINDVGNVTLQAAVLREGAPLLELTKPTSGAIFYAATNGIQFRVSTFSPNTIPTNQIKLFLNDEDVSSNLAIPARTLTAPPLTANCSQSLYQPDRCGCNLGQANNTSSLIIQHQWPRSKLKDNYGDGVRG